MYASRIALDEWNKSQFEAYAKLVLLKCGRQIENASNFIELADEQPESFDSDTVGSGSVDILSASDGDQLKRAFLDRLSELFANEKGGYHVSSALMVEWPDRVDVLVARNTKIETEHSSAKMLETIASSLRDISTREYNDTIAAETIARLWIVLIRQYKLRIEGYILEAKRSMQRVVLRYSDDMGPSARESQSSLLSRLETLRILLGDKSRLSTDDELGAAIDAAYRITKSHDEKEFERVVDSISNAKSLRGALGFLGRLRRCLNIFVRAAQRFSTFQCLRILPVISRSKNISELNRADPWSLGKTFASLNLDFDERTVKSLMAPGRNGNGWSKEKLSREFKNLKSPESQVHAEIQVILAATRYDCTGGSLFGYIGCSKRSCFLCFQFLNRHGQFKTRGCHGKIYDLWTVPDISHLVAKEHLAFIHILEGIQSYMKNYILDGQAERIPHARESTIGGSSLASMWQPYENPHIESLASRHLDAQFQHMMFHAINNGDSHSLDPVEEGECDITSGQSLSQRQPEESAPMALSSRLEEGECELCEIKTYRRCQHCDRGHFCSVKCQNRMSLNHLTKCSARPITPSDILKDDALQDEIPKDSETREAFGFTRCGDWREETYLFGLYKGLLLYLQDPEIDAVRVNEWQKKGLLKSKIIEKFSALPEDSRGAYFPWFLENQHVLDTPSDFTQSDIEQNPILNALNVARPYLEPEDRDQEPNMLRPLEKRYCFMFYALVLDSWTPNPNWVELDLWYDFGFAVCYDEHHERALGSLYNKLLGSNKATRDYYTEFYTALKHSLNAPKCSFGEFWRAWRDGNIPQLFDKYGLGDELSKNAGSSFERRLKGIRHLRGFMSVPIENHHLRPSIWRLKHFLALDENAPLIGFPQVTEAIAEYGFTHRLDARTKIELRQFYAHLLRNNYPLEIHKAKERGELLAQAEGLSVSISKRVRGVLQKLDSSRSKEPDKV